MISAYRISNYATISCIYVQPGYGLITPKGNQDNDSEWPDYNSNSPCTNPLQCTPPDFADEMFDADWTGQPIEGSLTDYYYFSIVGRLPTLGYLKFLKFRCVKFLNFRCVKFPNLTL